MDNFLTGRKSLEEAPEAPQSGPSAFQIVSEGSGASREAEDLPMPNSDAASQVQVVSENGTIRKIIVTCSCGQCTEIECRY